MHPDCYSRYSGHRIRSRGGSLADPHPDPHAGHRCNCGGAPTSNYFSDSHSHHATDAYRYTDPYRDPYRQPIASDSNFYPHPNCHRRSDGNPYSNGYTYAPPNPYTYTISNIDADTRSLLDTEPKPNGGPCQSLNCKD